MDYSQVESTLVTTDQQLVFELLATQAGTNDKPDAQEECDH